MLDFFNIRVASYKPSLTDDETLKRLEALKILDMM